MKGWRTLKKGDFVDVIAPGFKTTAEELRGAVSFLKAWGLVPRVPRDLLGKHFLFSNSEEVRWKHLHRALLANDSQAVWCLRGGYGSIRLLPYLKKMRCPKKTKLFIGLSDVTSLHVFFNQKWDWATLHGPMLDRAGNGKLPPEIAKHLRDIIFGEVAQSCFKMILPMNHQARSLKKWKSSIVGGNLTVLQSTLGTPYQFNTQGKFLFLEDLGERGYRVDRIMEQFRQAGLLKGCKGILLGQFIGDQEPQQQPGKVKDVFKCWADELKIPLFSEIEAGHDVWQWPLPLNTTCEIIKEEKNFNLYVNTGAVQ